ncbi:MAG: DUF1232 domain-containing protein [Acidobacteriota bacterium]
MDKLSVSKKGSFDDFYHRIRKKILSWFKSGKLDKKTGKWTDNFLQYLLVFPDLVHLLIKLFSDREVPPRIKGFIVMGFAYLISPIDIIPDFIPVAGLIDDLLITVIILNKIINSGDEKLVGKVKSYWAGEDDILVKVREITGVMNDVSSQIPKSISDFLKKRK